LGHTALTGADNGSPGINTRLDSEFPILVQSNAPVFVPKTNSDWLRAIPDVFGVVIVKDSGLCGLAVSFSDFGEERDAMEKDEFIIT
jgi:hypothetical protein